MKTITGILLILALFSTQLTQSDNRKTFVDRLLVQYDEEKFAHDYYMAMYDYWKLLAFKNLSKCEEAHMKVVKGLIDDFGETNSLKITEPGVFISDELNKSYDQLIAAGKKSENEALKVAGNFEEKYINNLEALISLPEGQANKDCLDNLLESSIMHLNLLVCHLRHRGAEYRPVLLSVSKYIKCTGDQFANLDDASANCQPNKEGINCTALEGQ